MATTKATPSRRTAATSRRGRTLGLLALLGALSAMWALFLWSELVASRAGGVPFCAFGQEDCAALWDAGFATAIHGTTGLPVAAWGLLWGLVAFLLPLVALVGASEGRRGGHFDSATAITGAVGIISVIVLVGASAAEGLFCASCVVTYGLTIAYGAVALVGLLGRDSTLSGRGLGIAAAVTLPIYLVLLYPGLRTPENVMRAGERAVAATVTERPAAEVSSDAAVEGADALLADLVANLSPPARQALSDSLFIYSTSPRVPHQEPRALHGAPGAPVRITEFSDVLCSHCAALRQTLDYLETVVPEGSLSVDSRNFPLDGNCNRHLAIRGPESVRCLASKVRICVDGTSNGEELARALFSRQEELTPELVFELAAPFMPVTELERCVVSRETEQELVADVDYAWLFEPDGTPLVLVDGRRGTSFGPFLYAMVLTGGNAEHPAFATLPPPNPGAHIH